MKLRDIIHAVDIAYHTGQRECMAGKFPNVFRGVVVSKLESELAEQAYGLGFSEALNGKFCKANPSQHRILGGQN